MDKYQIIKDYFDGKITQTEVAKRFGCNDRQQAVRIIVRVLREMVSKDLVKFE